MDIPHRAAEQRVVPCVVVLIAPRDAAALVQRRQRGGLRPQALDGALDARLVVIREISHAVNLDAALGCGLERAFRQRLVGRPDGRHNHPHRKPLLARGFDGARQILFDPLRFDVPLGPHRQIDAAAPCLRHRLGQVIIAQPIQRLGERMQANRLRRLRPRQAQRRRSGHRNALHKFASCHHHPPGP